MPAGKKIDVYVLSSYPVYREGLTGGLGRDARCQVVGASALLFGELDASPAFDLLLTDLSAPMDEELPLIAACRRLGRKAMVLGSPDRAADIAAVLDAGAAACLSRSAPLPEIAAAIVDIVSGQQPPADSQISEVVAELRVREANTDGGDSDITAPYLDLTRREHEVLRMVCAGGTNREIALCLDVSERTIRRHLTAIFQKTGVRNRTEAIAKLIRGADLPKNG